MATRYVDPDAAAGGDGTTNGLSGANCAYVSLSVWEAARQAVLSEVEECICESNGVGHTADTTATTIIGWTTTSSNYIDIKTSTAARHNGTYQTTKYRIELTDAVPITINEEYVNITGLQIKLTGTSGNRYGIITGSIGTSTINVKSCIVKGVDSGATMSGINNNDADCTLNVINCIIYPFDYAGVRSITGSLNVYNSTAVSCGTGYKEDGGTLTLYGCGASGCTTAWSAGASIPNSDCSSSTPTFAGAEDYHLAAADTTWQGGSTNYSATFTDDIDGQTRPAVGAWDIGADEYTAPAAPTTTIRRHIFHR